MMKNNKKVLLTSEDITFICKCSDLIIPNNSARSILGNDLDKWLNIRKTLYNVIVDVIPYYFEYEGLQFTSTAKGNPVQRNNNKLQRLWSCFYKGDFKKQKAAQIYLSINTIEKCFDVGFSFGFEKISQRLSSSIYQNLNSNDFENLSHEDFQFYKGKWNNEVKIKASEWYTGIGTNPSTYRIVKHIKGNISLEMIRKAIDKLIFLMDYIPNSLMDTEISRAESIPKSHKYSVEQYFAIAERKKEIGNLGEKYVFDLLSKQLKEKFTSKEITGYPNHVAQNDDCCGYDILTLDDNGQEIFVEVKSTTKRKSEPSAKVFFLSKNEFDFMKSHSERYRIYRVYDICGVTNHDVFCQKDIELTAKDYLAKIKK